VRVEACLRELRAALRVARGPRCEGHVFGRLDDRLGLRVELEGAALAVPCSQLLHRQPEGAVLTIADKHRRLAWCEQDPTPLAIIHHDLGRDVTDVHIAVFQAIQSHHLTTEGARLPDNDLLPPIGKAEWVQQCIALPEASEVYAAINTRSLEDGFRLCLAEAEVVADVAAEVLEAELPVPRRVGLVEDLEHLLLLGRLPGPRDRRQSLQALPSGAGHFHGSRADA